MFKNKKLIQELIAERKYLLEEYFELSSENMDTFFDNVMLQARNTNLETKNKELELRNKQLSEKLSDVVLSMFNHCVKREDEHNLVVEGILKSIEEQK